MVEGHVSSGRAGSSPASRTTIYPGTRCAATGSDVIEVIHRVATLRDRAMGQPDDMRYAARLNISPSRFREKIIDIKVALTPIFYYVVYSKH